MPRTRSTKPTTAEAQETDNISKPSSSKFALEPRSENPPKLFVLPKRATEDARIVTLPHPRHGKPSRYLVCPETGFYEFTKISNPKSPLRSWLVEHGSNTLGEDSENQNETSKGQVVAGANLFIATSIDPLFLVLPALAELEVTKSPDDKKRLFLSSEDYLDKLPEESSHLSEIMRWEKTRGLVEARMTSVCDTVEAGDETMYRLNKEKLVATCLQKARNVAEGGGLPPSMEKHFVTKALQAPVLNQRRAENPKENQPINDSVESGQSTPQTDSNESRSTSATTETAATSVTDEPAEVEQAIKPSQEVISLQKLRVAFEFICERLMSPPVARWINEDLAKEDAGGIRFAPLDEYLTQIAKLRAEALASRSIGDYSHKRLRDEEEEEAREQKKQKLEEEKKRKANESRGVKELKKVNTSGMKKLSHFFQKK